MARFGGSKNFYEFGNDCSGQRSAGDDRSEFPPLRFVAAETRNDEPGSEVRQADGNEGSDPHERSQRRLEIHFVGVAVFRFSNCAVDEIRQGAGHQHDNAHHENPNEQLYLHRVRGCRGFGDHRSGSSLQGQTHGQKVLWRNREQNKSDERDAGHAVSFKSVGGRPNRIPRIVAGAIGDDAGISRIVFLDFEDDFHEVGADVGNFGEDSAGDAEGGGAEGFADGEADEARAGIITGYK